ncbi:MAG: caspase family protein, partial [Bacteroidota bacterium]
QTLLSVSLDNQAKLWDTKGNLLQEIEYNFGNTNTSFSPDGQQLIIGSRAGEARSWNLNGKPKTSFEHEKAIRSVDFSMNGDLVLTSSDDQTVKLWKNSGGEEATLTLPNSIRSIGFSPDSLSFFVNTIGALIFYDLTGKQAQIIRHNGSMNSVAITSDGKMILTAGEDHTLKFWDRTTGKERLRYINIDDQDWIALTPEGLFDASPGAMNLMHYIVYYQNTYEVIELEQLKARYYEPGLLQKVLNYSDERLRPIQNFNSIALYPEIEAKIESDRLKIDLKERNGGIGKVSIFINGKEVIEEANPIAAGGQTQRADNINYDLKQHQNYLFRHPDSTNIISIRAYNEAGWLKSKSVELEYQAKYRLTKGKDEDNEDKDWQASLDPKLYVVSIGTSNYTGTQLDLKYADQDASVMASAMNSVGTSLFSSGDSLSVYCLSTAATDSLELSKKEIQWDFASKENIKQVFDDIKAKAKAEDIIAVYLSGHGITQGGSDETQFYYLTQGVASEDDLADPMALDAYTISSDELTKWINDIPALKQVLIIDACNSGQVVENLTSSSKSLNSSQIRALDRMKDRTGMFVLSGSASDKVSYEASEYGQGLLTYALLQGMLGLATRKDAEGKEIVDVMKLFQYARDQVPQLAASIQGIQTPMWGFPSQGASFDIGILDNKAKKNIQLGNKKPVVIRSIFQNLQTFGDDLNLVSSIEQAFRKESNKGKNADLIYVDVNNYPGAFALRGLYEVDGENITLKLKVFQDEKAIHDLPEIKTDKPGRLPRILLRSLKKYLNTKPEVTP